MKKLTGFGTSILRETWYFGKTRLALRAAPTFLQLRPNATIVKYRPLIDNDPLQSRLAAVSRKRWLGIHLAATSEANHGQYPYP